MSSEGNTFQRLADEMEKVDIGEGAGVRCSSDALKCECKR
jgi:hypothetical protein